MASGSYVAVGWDAAQDLGYDEIVDLRFKATVFNVFNKVLFDYIDDKFYSKHQFYCRPKQMIIFSLKKLEKCIKIPVSALRGLLMGYIQPNAIPLI